jgi:succinate-semialdehyde dehydrogenase/glutarate-semialdehyde dehydrogenase
MPIRSVNPATGEVLAEFAEHTPAQVEAALSSAHAAFQPWRETPIGERSRLMRAAAAYLRRDRDRLARLITAEMGKPITESEAEIEKSAWGCEFYAENAARFLADQHIASSASESYVAFQPLGAILAVMPWNFPFWQVLRFAAPTLMAGNVALLKHASNVPGCAVAIEQVFHECGFPAGAFQTLLVRPPAIDAIIEDQRVAAVTLTGSDTTGSNVAGISGRSLKKIVLELGGSDPFIVLGDADVDAAATTAARARFLNTGQSCIAAKRFIVVDSVLAEFTARFRDAVARLKVGDPMDRATQVGPLAREDLREALERQVRDSAAAGARIALGGTRLEGRGYFFAPTILSGVTREMAAFREETFGPLAAVVRAADEHEALRLANASRYGLGASLWTRDVERARGLARRIESGSVFINGMVMSDPRLPFGGVKRSGYGRELSEFGIREFVNIQTTWIGPART